MARTPGTHRKRLRRKSTRKSSSPPVGEGSGSETLDHQDPAAPPVDETVLPRFTAGADQHFQDVVDFSAFPPDLKARISLKAPFVLGIGEATYNEEFFNQVAGLCASGPHPNDITENMMPRSKWARNWGDAATDSTSRIWLKDAATDDIRERYESLYYRVYGNKPDNGGMANFFLRAATYYLEEGHMVNWAAFASEVCQKRIANHELNPQKLVPPCLTKQVQGMVDEFAAILAQPIRTAPAPEEMKANGNIGGPASLHGPKERLSLAHKEEFEAINEVLSLKNIVNIDLPEALMKAEKALACHTSDLEHLFETKKEAQMHGDNNYVEFAKVQITAVAQTICDITKQQQDLQNQLKMNTASLAAAEEELNFQESVVQDAQCNLLDSISEVGLFPKHALWKLPAGGPMEQSCPYCTRLYIQNAFIPLSCSCRYHPPCMRALILSGHNTHCMGCGKPVHGTWMAYWGFPLDERMSKELKDYVKEGLHSDQWVEADRARVGGPSCFIDEVDLSTNQSGSMVLFEPRVTD